MHFDVDLFVIGGGSGGVRAARIAAGYGAKVMLAEEFRLGGTCVIRGCVPKKLLVYASRFREEFREAEGFGWTVGSFSHDWVKLVSAKEREITRLESLYAQGQSAAGVTVVKSRAIIEDAHTIRLLTDERRIRAKNILIATGGHPNIDSTLPGVEHTITSNEAFDLPIFPNRIVIAGGGYIAIEFAGIFAGLGSEVTLIHRGDMPLRNFDHDLRQGVLDAYRRRGIRILLNDGLARIEKTGNGLIGHTRAGETLAADQIMMAIGRSPNTRGLGLENAGVTLEPNGSVKVDAFHRTKVPHIFAVGDVTDHIALTPVAIREGHAVADHLFGGKDNAVDYRILPTAVFSTPEIGTVGLTEAEARAEFPVVDMYRATFRPMKQVMSGGTETTMMKLLVDGISNKVLGCHILGEHAGEIVQSVAIAMQMGATKADFDATIALHPSAAEELVTMRTRTARFER